MVVIEVKNLTKYYGKLLAVDKLTFSVGRGECVGLLGPNGAGKTTTIKILTGLLRPTSGEAYINNINVVENPTTALQDVGAMIETPEFYPEVSPRKILRFLGRLRGLSGSYLEERIRKVLEIVRMSFWADKPIGEFSRGMKQRIGIAQALLHDPEILILDEPSLGLDPTCMVEVRNILLELRGEGKTILLASHLLYEVQKICNKVALINRGKLILFDEIKTLISKVGGAPYELKLVSKVDYSTINAVSNLPMVRDVKKVGENVLRVILTEEEEAPNFLRSIIAEHGLKVSEFKIVEVQLEDIYLKFIREVS